VWLSGEHLIDRGPPVVKVEQKDTDGNSATPTYSQSQSSESKCKNCKSYPNIMDNPLFCLGERFDIFCSDNILETKVQRKELVRTGS